MDELRYPIGKFQAADPITPVELNKWINVIEQFPEALSNEVKDLTQEQLQWRYRPEGWTIRQLVHHCADSHINSQMRFKLALTEDEPQIRPYLEDRWAELPDIESPIEFSLMILNGVHHRWTYLLRKLTPEQLKKRYFHPEHQKHFQLDWTIGMYAWHSNHHLAHVRLAKDKRLG